MLEKKLLSFVIPCYRSEKTIGLVIDEIIDVVKERKQYDYEIITVNDCSPDNVLDVLKARALDNHRIKIIDFSKNMGKHSAVMAGYSIAKGDFIIDLDDDCQCPINQLWKLLEPVEKDECDYATAKYMQKKESVIKILGSNFNSLMIQILLDKPKGLRFENFSVMKRYVKEEIVKYKNPYPYIEGLVLRVTRRIKTVELEERERGDDNASGFTLKKSISLLLNGLTSFSVKPLRVASVIGFLFAVIGFLWGIYAIVKKIMHPDILMGYSSLLAINLFSSGMMMIMLGLIGEYIGRIFICINNSPQYVIREMINIDEEE